MSLTNGISIGIRRSASPLVLERKDGGLPIKKNTDWDSLCYDGTIRSFGVGDQAFHVRWTFRNTGAPLYLFGGDTFEFVLHDNFSHLTNHLFFLNGAWLFGTDQASENIRTIS